MAQKLAVATFPDGHRLYTIFSTATDDYFNTLFPLTDEQLAEFSVYDSIESPDGAVKCQAFLDRMYAEAFAWVPPVEADPSVIEEVVLSVPAYDDAYVLVSKADRTRRLVTGDTAPFEAQAREREAAWEAERPAREAEWRNTKLIQEYRHKRFVALAISVVAGVILSVSLVVTYCLYTGEEFRAIHVAIALGAVGLLAVVCDVVSRLHIRHQVTGKWWPAKRQ